MVVVQYLSQTGKRTSKNTGNDYYIVHTIRRATSRDNVTGSLVCNSIFVSPDDIHLFAKCQSGKFYGLVYESDGRYSYLADVVDSDDEF